MRIDLRAKLHLLDDGLLLVAPRLPSLECALILELAKVHELAHGRARHRRHLDQIQAHVGGQLKGALQWDHTHLLDFWTDKPYLPGTNLHVDPMLDADGASSTPYSAVRPCR